MAKEGSMRSRQTLVNLYLQRDRIRWYWRAIGTAAAWFILLGFIIFPCAFNDANVKLSKGALSTVAIVVLALGYVTTSLLCWKCQNMSFQLDIIFIPCFTSCALGLINVLYNVLIKSLAWNTLSVTAISLASASMILYGIAAASTAHNIDIIRKREARSRDPNTWQEDSSLLPEDEMTRQQLLRLLLRNDADKPPSSATTLSTFRIDLPEYTRSDDEEERRLARPHNTYDGRSARSDSRNSDQRLSPQSSGPGSGPRGFGSFPAAGSQAAQLSPRSPGHQLSPHSAGRGESRPQSREMRRQELESGPRRPETEPVNFVPRINRVQTDGWHA